MEFTRHQKTKRILLVDALRGFALMGLFMVHMVEYFELYWYKQEPSIFKDFTFFLFGGKAYAVFALLFGFSFFVIMHGQEKRGVDFRLRFSWRLLLLLLGGILHGLIYGGDILQILAIMGFLLIPVYRAKNSILLFLTMFFLIQFPAIVALNFFIDTSIIQQPYHWNLFGPVLKVYAEGSFNELLSTTIWDAQFAKWMFMLESGRLSTILGMSLLGFWLGKIDFFTNIEKYKKHVFSSFGIFLFFAFVMITSSPEIEKLLGVEQNWILSSIIGSYSDLSFTLAGLALFIILYRLDLMQRLLDQLAPCGRMSLSIYVMQSLIFVPVFYGFGLGAYGYLGQSWSFFLGIIFWLLQVLLARYWVLNYHYGPLEWAWRSATFMSGAIKFKRAK